MNRRPELLPIFKALINNDNVYFQPAEDLKMNYPCIRYKLSEIKQWKANNEQYAHRQCYEVVYISRVPDDALVNTILKTFDHISFSGVLVVNNLYHYRYKLYY